uniref:RNA-directed DNA polymerase, eukaryota n=1 Tax=Tanacetum cinerariifolium TaxID=118510 RepID=A0A6L2M118_TANCI|nr:RNA-directed DNA polymerase, eukaryota [Tanacetum cinerariifolium]
MSSHGLMGRIAKMMQRHFCGPSTPPDDSLGNSGGILCVWEATIFKKVYATISNNFQVSCKRILWDYVATLIGRWNGEAIIVDDFNKVRSKDERRGSSFNPSSARFFDHFTSSSDHFLVSDGIISLFPSITAVCLDRHLSDHRSILLHEDLKVIIRCWVKDKRVHMSGAKVSIRNELCDIEKELDHDVVSDANLLRQLELKRQLHDINLMEAKDSIQKSKVKWAIEGDENSKFFHGLINKKFSRLVIREVFVDGIWRTNPGEWSDTNLRGIINILKCFFLASGLKINIQKSQLLGVGVMVGECMSRHKAWEDTVLKLNSRLSKWTVKTLSIGGRLTLFKSVIGASPLYNMSIFKVPRGILKVMEAIRNFFYIGAHSSDKKITWAAWDKVLASKNHGGLGVSSFHALNRALLLKWIRDKPLRVLFPLLFALESDKDAFVAVKMVAPVDHSFRRTVRDGLEQQKISDMVSLLESVSLSTSQDRWICDLSGDGEFWVKVVGNLLDDMLFPFFLNPRDGSNVFPLKLIFLLGELVGIVYQQGLIWSVAVSSWSPPAVRYVNLARRTFIMIFSVRLGPEYHASYMPMVGFGVADLVVVFGVAGVVFFYSAPV